SMAAAFESGAKDVDIAQVMIEVQKAGLAFRAMTEVRNKLVQAYQDVMNMPL
ncbi:MAG: flagellar hook-basal body complex protein FliE, partial [Steroidobacterales bacterium]